jgi:hypothetical protein
MIVTFAAITSAEMPASAIRRAMTAMKPLNAA